MSNSTELTDREYIPLCVLNIFFALTAIVLNSVTIHVISNETSSGLLPKNVRVLLLDLAFSDLSVGLQVEPFYIINLTFRFKSQQGENLQTMDPLSLVTGILVVCASVLRVLALISVDRYLAVHLHLRYQEIVTPKRVVSILILIWVIRATISLLGIAKHYNRVRLIFQSIFLAVCMPHNDSVTSM